MKRRIPSSRVPFRFPACRLLLAAFAVLGSVAPAQAQFGPLGPQFQVNTYTTNGQNYSKVASLGAAGFVVVWHSSGASGTDLSGFSIQAQRYTSSAVTRVNPSNRARDLGSVCPGTGQGRLER